MGLDMYLMRMPRYKDCTADTVSLIENYLDFLEYRKKPDKAETTFMDWCGHSESELPEQDVLEFYRPFYTRKHEDDVFKHIYEVVGYWRKVNAVHKWFVENVQCGEDDCDYHREVTAEDLRNLIAVCTTVISGVKLMPGKIHTGMTFHNGKVEQMYEDGFVVSNPSICRKLLPTESGFFFGGLDYDEYYVADLQETIKICTEALNTTDFSTQMLYYHSSW